jgi:NADH-quinone oxidoreductase subunit C
LSDLNTIIPQLAEAFESAVLEDSYGQAVVRLDPSDWVGFGQAAKETGFEVCVDVTAVDWMRARSDRFEVVANLLSMQHRLRLRMSTTLGRNDPTLGSLVPVWPGANFAEREVYDMFGIEFENHPDLTRILMPDEWEGFPLRKDFGVGGVPVQFKASHQVN